LGLLFSAFNLFSTEYFFGLELLRPVFLWLGLRRGWPDWQARLNRAILTYLPFFLALVGFLYWRYFILGFYLYQPELVSNLGSSPAVRLANLPGTIWEQWKVTSLGAWRQIFQSPDFAAYGLRLAILFIVVLSLTGIGLYELAKRYKESERASWSFSIQWLGLGILAMLLAGAYLFLIIP